MWKKWIPRIVIICGLFASGMAFLLTNLEYGESNSRTIASEAIKDAHFDY